MLCGAQHRYMQTEAQIHKIKIRTLKEAERDDVDAQITFSFLLSPELQLMGSAAGTWSGQVGQSGVNRDHPKA